MEKASTNPLLKNFRQPALYLRLPSKGKYWPEEALEFPVTEEIPVYPMTTRDEIIIRTPDALLNGDGVVKVIQNCCPNIKNAWQMPSIDVDAVLIAIRTASYGHEMEIDSTCVSCQQENNHVVDLNFIQGRLTAPNYNDQVSVMDVKIKLKPQQYFDINKRNKIMFEEQRIINTVTDSELTEEEKVARYNEYLANLVNLNMELLSSSTESIENQEGQVVTEPDFILEYYNNAPGQVIRAIQRKIEKFNEMAELPKLNVKCDGCGTDYEVKMEFDYANFFAPGSSN